MQLYTSEEILNDDDDSVINQIQEDVSSTCKGIKYKMTEGELGWLDHVKGKYSIADYISKNLEGDILTLDMDAHHFMSIALDEDCEGAGKAVMLSDDTALQRIIFYCYQPDTVPDEE